ncbi:MAG: response regulator [Ghiorsea sp.]
MSGFDLSNFIASFFDEARERLSSINQALVDFETGVLDDEGLIALRRDAHTIKGSALMLGVNDVGGIAHLFEDMVEALIEHGEWRIPEAIQFLYDLHDQLDKRLEDPEGKELLDTAAAELKFKEVLQRFQNVSGDTKVDEVDPASLLEKEMGALGAEVETFDETIELEVPRDIDVDHDNITLDKLDAFLDGKEENDDTEEDFSVVIEEEGIDLTGLDEELEKEVLEAKVDGHEVITSEAPIDVDSDAIADNNETFNYRPVSTGEEKKGSGVRQSSGRFLRVDAERLEGLSHQVIEMSTEQSRSSQTESDLKQAQVDLRTLRREWRKVRYLVEEKGSAAEPLAAIDRLIDAQVKQMRRMTDEARFQVERSGFTLRELRDQVLSLMLRPLDSVFSTFPRAVRDVATKIGKNVRLVVDGKSVEMDQGVSESLVEPLIHLLNNAVAHGIEDEAERLRLGKTKEGQVTIVARQSGNEVRIEVMDDGRGIDPEMIKRVAVERGVTTQDEVDLMDSAEILEMIFRPGFSTLTEVDTLAGRGIGMNVVQDAIRRLTGSIRIHSEIGKGTRFVVTVPVSVAVQQALMFKIGDQQYGMLTHMIEQAVAYDDQKVIHGAAGKEFLPYGAHQVPIVDLRPMMLGEGAELSETPYIIVAEHIEGFVGILVDELLGDGEIVVRDLDPYIKRYQPQGLMGNTIVEDGSVVMLLEPYGIKEMGRTSPSQNLVFTVDEADKLHFNVLLVDDSLIAREVEKGIFEQLGFVVETAIDGMDAMEKLEVSNYDMIVTDLEMPRLDGFGLVRQIRNQPKYEEMPVMVISTRESSEDRLRALEAGADSYLVKQHLDGNNIIATVKGLVGPLMVQARGIEHKPEHETH